jgi:prepilin-type processing-associated H-X9-DG protein
MASTLLVLLFMALLRIQRPEGLKEQVPAELGMLVGLDRSPEVKTLRHELERLASLRRAEQFGQELARLRVETRGETLGFLYVDGHVRVYHGKHHLPKAHVTRMRISLGHYQQTPNGGSSRRSCIKWTLLRLLHSET